MQRSRSAALSSCWRAQARALQEEQEEGEEQEQEQKEEEKEAEKEASVGVAERGRPGGQTLILARLCSHMRQSRLRFGCYADARCTYAVVSLTPSGC